jgi:hypothetical protein
MTRGRLLICFALLAFLLPSANAQEEVLSYSINWPSGLSLGEALISSKPSGDGYEYQMTLQAAIPNIPVRDDYRSLVNAAGCSLEFQKDSLHAVRKASEKSTFDPEKGTIDRETSGGGGKSRIQAEPCARDALAFLFFLRKELAQGRLPGAQNVYFGSPYQIKLQYAGFQPILTGDTRVEADKLTAMVKGPASEVAFEMYFARDKTRTPIMVKLPLSMGTFSMELLR